jgi:hypothetical protein
MLVYVGTAEHMKKYFTDQALSFPNGETIIIEEALFLD